VISIWSVHADVFLYIVIFFIESGILRALLRQGLASLLSQQLLKLLFFSLSLDSSSKVAEVFFGELAHQILLHRPILRRDDAQSQFVAVPGRGCRNVIVVSYVDTVSLHDGLLHLRCTQAPATKIAWRNSL